MHPDAEQAARLIRIPKGLRIDVWASEPLLKNPVGFTFDERGRAYVVETFRYRSAGVWDNRHRLEWPTVEFRKKASPERLANIANELLDRELAARTVEDRQTMIDELMDVPALKARSERVELVEDTNGDGRADRHTIFADGFNDPLDGIASSVLARKNDLFLTNIPHLWVLRDGARKSMFSGFGVRYAFAGHDLHGLRIGPDGRLYFSLGDRGAHVKTAEGGTIALPETGGIFRCELDGSNLELFAYGNRNPQDLVFDEHGNLFTGDNNSDGGDKARWVYVVEGGDSGWRIGYQYLDTRGPWNAEKMWHPAWAGQAAHLVPPIQNITNGPSGAAYYPGTGLPKDYAGRFFLADFKGQSTLSGIWSFTLKPAGASFQMVGEDRSIWGVLATDVEFGVDGGLYVLDWTQGWLRPGKGRIFRVHDPAVDKDSLVRETRQLMADGMGKRAERDLLKLLGHADMRVRQEAQFELALRGEGGTLTEAATRGRGLGRLHGIWGLGQLLRKNKQALSPALIALMSDPDAEVRAQALRVLGDARLMAAAPEARRLLTDQSPRVQFFAAQALGRIGAREAFPDLLQLLARNADRDPYLRHAAVMGLLGTADDKALLGATRGVSPSVRLGVLLALRRKRSPEVARFLKDSDPLLVREAARAINDDKIDEGVKALAAVKATDAPTLLRVVNANFRLGKAEGARRLATLATGASIPPEVRSEAVAALAEWNDGKGRDRVTGLWHPLSAGARDRGAAAAALARPVTILLRDSPDPVRQASLKAVRALQLRAAVPALVALVKSRQAGGALRAEALATLATLETPDIAKVLEAVSRDAEPRVRVAALRIQVKRDPAHAAPVVDRAMGQGTIIEKQAALAAVRTLPAADAEALLGRWLDDLLAGRVPPEIALDLLEAAMARKSPVLGHKLASYEAARPKDELGRFRETLAGGDPEEGRDIFWKKAEVACLRCHRLRGEGGDVGPDMDGIGAKRDRQYLLEAVVTPNKQLAEGFESVILTMADGSIKGGVLRKETADTLEVASPDEGMQILRKGDVKKRERGASGMPDGFGDILTRRELRDLVEYMSTLK